MRDAAMFDTHAYVKRLRAVGFTEEQAEVQAETLSELVNNELATKKDLQILKTELQAAIVESKADVIKWVAAMLVAQAAVIAAFIKLLSH